MRHEVRDDLSDTGECRQLPHREYRASRIRNAHHMNHRMQHARGQHNNAGNRSPAIGGAHSLGYSHHGRRDRQVIRRSVVGPNRAVAVRGMAAGPVSRLWRMHLRPPGNETCATREGKVRGSISRAWLKNPEIHGHDLLGWLVCRNVDTSSDAAAG